MAKSLFTALSAEGAKASPGGKLPLFLRAVVGSGIITMVELSAGLVFNRSYTVWDYRDQWGNWLGQICPLFSLLWIGIAALVLLIYDPLEKFLMKNDE